MIRWTILAFPQAVETTVRTGLQESHGRGGRGNQVRQRRPEQRRFILQARLCPHLAGEIILVVMHTVLSFFSGRMMWRNRPRRPGWWRAKPAPLVILCKRRTQCKPLRMRLLPCRARTSSLMAVVSFHHECHDCEFMHTVQSF